MRLTMKERKSVTREIAPRSRKRQKGIILTEFMELTQYTRCYASYLLRNHGRQVRVAKNVIVQGDIGRKQKRKRARTYDEDVFVALRKIWLIMDCIWHR